MARAVIAPLHVGATAPETFMVLQQRISTAEEQAQALIRELGVLGVNSQELLGSKSSETSGNPRPISPFHARTAFIGDSDVLWKNYESLVSRVCRMESTIQTLKLHIFRLQTEKELNPNHSAHLTERLTALQEEHLQELKKVQREMMRLRQQLRELNEEKEAAQEEIQRLSAALETATATKMDIALAAEEMRTVKGRMSRRLQEVKEQLSQEIALRSSLEESHTALLQRIQDTEKIVEAERKEVHTLQEECHVLRKDVQLNRERLQQEQERANHLDLAYKELKNQADAKDSIVYHLSEEAKNTQVAFSKVRDENAQLRSEIQSLQETAEKVQALNDQLDHQCKELSSTLRAATMENAKLISEHQSTLKAEQEKLTQKLHEQDLLLDAARANIASELKSVQTERAQLQKKLESLNTEYQEMKRKAQTVEEKAAAQKTLHETIIARMHGELETTVQERDSFRMEKEELTRKMKKELSEVTKDRNVFEMELTANKLELSALTTALRNQEEENGRLMERLAALEQQQHAQQQVEQVLGELTESRNKLAYDKGKLETKVQQLQEELQSLTTTQSESVQLRKLNIALDAKYNQANADLSSCRIATQRLETQLKQAQSLLERKEEEFSLAIKSRDEALREVQKLKGHSEALEERDRQKIGNLQRQLSESKQDNGKMASTLENVLASHTKLQQILEKLQMELGSKDSELINLRRERSQNQQGCQQLQSELEALQAKLLSVETQYNNQVESLRRSLETSREDNRRLALSLEQALQTSSNLQSKRSHLQDELDKQELQHQQQLNNKDQELDDAKTEARLFTERLEMLKKQFKNERETARKAFQKELGELKKTLEESASRSSDVSRANRELRQKMVELEKTSAKQKAKIKSQKAQIKHYSETKVNNIRNTERIKEIEAELKQMETVKEQYQKKSHEQSQIIQNFMTEMTSLQTEIQELAKGQHDAVQLNRRQEIQLEKECKTRQDLEDRCQNLEENIRKLKKSKEALQEKLKEASLESQQISTNLEEAHRWFKSRFEALQTELVETRCHSDPQSDLTQQKISWEAEEGKNTTAVPSPGQWVQHFKDRPVKLPSQASLNRWETKHELKLLSRKYQAEKDKQ
ncbi:coiled-coil domain-containing protein 150 [Protopterus annectens]|uniref:coiled-coil domain-containing protein 150 n=1 Tax=Protopterus annectens TaxID=7888 RepID=UPI001CF9E6C7|nr:coiled-coil domain-containing protein 150 [Protopterus annectens]